MNGSGKRPSPPQTVKSLARNADELYRLSDAQQSRRLRADEILSHGRNSYDRPLRQLQGSQGVDDITPSRFGRLPVFGDGGLWLHPHRG